MKTKVYMMEYERGWGSRIDEIKTFESHEAATKFAEEYNGRWNNKPTVPDWYILAEVERLS